MKEIAHAAPPAPPLYRAGGHTYRIDTCRPQRVAVDSGRIRFHGLSTGAYPGAPLDPRAVPGISSVGFWDAVGPQDWGLEPHRNEGIEVTFLETGRLAFRVGGEKYALAAGDVTVTRPWQVHTLGDPHIGAGRLHWFVLDVGVRRPNQPWRWPGWLVLSQPDRDELERLLRGNEHPVVGASPEVRTGFRRVADAVRQSAGRVAVSELRIGLNEVLLGLLVALRRRNWTAHPAATSSQRAVDLFLRDLQQQASSAAEPWTVSKMASECGIGVTQFTRLCRELVNATPMEWVNHCRLHHARALLERSPGTSVTAVAFTSGFSSSQYFATRFRRLFGKPPRVWRGREAGP